ncbi:MAG: BrnT family toxin [Treponema sp.]|jgi:uncharacterized DUF497 family protein|nr:BrnT family toxin [Treponema sp.]
MKITWDPEKEKENIKKHRMGFSYAAEVFHDANRLVRYDEAHSGEEDRYIHIGKADDAVVVFVVETEPTEDEIRIITARKANKRERTVYVNSEL